MIQRSTLSTIRFGRTTTMPSLLVLVGILLSSMMITITHGQDDNTSVVYPQPNVTPMNYTEGSSELQGYLAVPTEEEAGTGPFPAVIIIP